MLNRKSVQKRRNLGRIFWSIRLFRAAKSAQKEIKKICEKEEKRQKGQPPFCLWLTNDLQKQLPHFFVKFTLPFSEAKINFLAIDLIR